MSGRKLVVHHDDLGGSHAANMAYADLWEHRRVSAGSIMIPGADLMEIFMMTRTSFDDDLGVHLTLNAEFDKRRWRPLTGVSDNGLTDKDGFFPKTVAELRNADPKAVEAECRAQIDTAVANGLILTHLDTHMMALYLPEFISIYERLGQDYGLPIVIGRNFVAQMDLSEAYKPLFKRLEARGNPVFDHLAVSPLNTPGAGPADYAAILDALPEGLSYAAFHCTTPGDIERFAPDAANRINEYRLFSAGTLKEMMDERGIEMVGMRGIAQGLQG